MIKIKKRFIIGTILVFILVISISAFSQEADYCCEKTTYRAWCQNTKQENCDSSKDPRTGNPFRKTPTSCEATSFCREGCCYDSIEGLCMESTPQRVCDEEGGTWSESEECDIPQCQLGCCVLDNQAAFVTLTRCKRLSSLYGLETDFRGDIDNEIDCITVAQLQDRGACVYEEDYTVTCKFTTREQCLKLKSIGNLTEPVFYKDYLCSAEELGTICGLSEKTMCVGGKDEVYFVDTCGNPANIYDASKVEDKSYWKKIIDKSESCGFGNSNANSGDCGNCDYYLGSICKKTDRGEKPEYGDYKCEDLNCYDTSDGKDHRHGESWCSYDANVGKGADPVGSRHFKHVCVAGEELIEPCADLRGEICIESKTETSSGVFIEAACRANRWGDCVKQKEKDDCENTDRRDCYWVEGVQFTQSKEGNTGESGGVSGLELGGGACVPNYPPGFQFWQEGEAEGICKTASAQCIVEYEKGLFGSKKPVENEECLEKEWAEKMNLVCSSMGDCGGYVNWLGKYTADGYDWKIGSSKQTLSQGIISGIKSRAGT